jgi:hypothetical protein
MGMVLCYIRVSPANAAFLLQRPALIHSFLSREEAALPEVKRGFLSKLFGGKTELPKPESLIPSFEPREEDDEGDTDKAWQAMHYLFTGTVEGGTFPEGFILHGGTPVGDEDVGYDPARLFQPEEVQRIDAVLQAQSEDDIRQRYDGKKMDAERVYPQIWQRDGAEGAECIWGNIELMKDFVRETVEKKWALLVYIG